jgi:hypothetical protein
MFGKKNIRDFGKIYNYLQDGFLRVEETSKRRLTIQGAVFSAEEFKGSSWGYFDFVNCVFTGAYQIMLRRLVNCTFSDCHFDGIFGFGDARNTHFLRCKINGASHLGFNDETENLVFEESEFLNPDGDPNHRSSIGSVGEITFIGCKSRNFTLEGYKKLTLRRCTIRSGRLGTAASGEYSDKSQMPHSDFWLEDCDLGSTGMDNLELNHFTLKNCKVGFLETMGSVALGDVLVEGVKEGLLDLSASDFRGKLTVRNCSFYQSYDGYSFQCSGIIPAHTLIENVVCGSSPANVSGAPREMTEEDRLPQTQNQSFLIRNCKIPHLQVDWAQTEHLRIEDCAFDSLHIRNGRIGRLEIVGCSLRTLDVSHTQVKTQDVRVPEGGKFSGHVTVTTGSNIELPRE